MVCSGENPEGIIVSLAVSSRKGEKKKPVKEVLIRKNWGIEGDAHAGTPDREVSLLEEEIIREMEGGKKKIFPGDFAENITTRGISLHTLPPGTRIQIGEEVILEITRMGKKCPSPCWIYQSLGNCAMRERGIFTRVIQGGKVKVGDNIKVYKVKEN